MLTFSNLTQTTRLAALCAGFFLGPVIAPAQTLVAWGDNSLGQTNVPSGTYTAIAAGDRHSLALKTDGTLAAWGDNCCDQTTSVPGGTYTAIAAGGRHSLALKTDGTLVAWGNNGYGQTTVPGGTYTAIAAGYWHNLALKTDGTLVAWGNFFQGQTDVPAGTYTAIAAGTFSSMALKTDGTLAAWGDLRYPPSGITNVPAGTYSAIAAGCCSYHGLAITRPLYTFSGFVGAVNGPPTVNTGKAGRTYPVKFRLTNSIGTPVSALSAVRSITYNPVACNFGASPTDAIEAEATGNSSLRYDSLDNQYIYNWASPSQPGCYVLLLALDDGQSFAAWFDFK